MFITVDVVNERFSPLRFVADVAVAFEAVDESWFLSFLETVSQDDVL